MFLGYVQSRDRKVNKSPKINNKEGQICSLESAPQKVNYILETVRLTQSQQFQGAECQFQFNIISPKDQQKNQANPEILTYQYKTPEWIKAESNKTSVASKQQKNDQNNCNVYHDEPTYIRGIQEVQKTQIYSHSINGQQINSKCEERNSSISGEKILQQNQFNYEYKNIKSSDEEDKSVKSLQFANKSHLVEKILNKSSCVTLHEMEQLQKIHNNQFQVFSQYGLKPNECKRLQKIQNIQRVQLEQRYLGTKQNGMKIRKYSQAVAQTHKKNSSKQSKLSKKSLSKQKKILQSQKILINKVHKVK